MICPDCKKDVPSYCLEEEGGGCPECNEAYDKAEAEKERQEYYKIGYSETQCGYCCTTQWMDTKKPVGKCCECGEDFDNENYDEVEDLKNQRNKLNRKISTLKKASLEPNAQFKKSLNEIEAEQEALEDNPKDFFECKDCKVKYNPKLDEHSEGHKENLCASCWEEAQPC